MLNEEDLSVAETTSGAHQVSKLCTQTAGAAYCRTDPILNDPIGEVAVTESAIEQDKTTSHLSVWVALSLMRGKNSGCQV